jgi:hypothetical protein
MLVSASTEQTKQHSEKAPLGSPPTNPPSAFHNCIHTHPFFLVAMEFEGAQDGAEASNLLHPVPESGFGHNDQVRTSDPLELVQETEERNRLESLPQPLQNNVGGKI